MIRFMRDPQLTILFSRILAFIFVGLEVLSFSYGPAGTPPHPCLAAGPEELFWQALSAPVASAEFGKASAAAHRTVLHSSFVKDARAKRSGTRRGFLRKAFAGLA